MELQDASAERGSHQANARAPTNAQLRQIRARPKELPARGSVLLNSKETLRACQIVSSTHRPANSRHITMALTRPLPGLLQALFPTLNGPVRPVVNLPLLQRLSQPFHLMPTQFAAIALPSLTLPRIPSISDIWEGILKAVPKKKTSHRKGRQRFMAGKALKDLTNLNKCAACGRVKRAHILCPYCVNGMLCQDTRITNLANNSQQSKPPSSKCIPKVLEDPQPSRRSR
jgi:large subunit ribosomal protein L32